MCVHTKRLLSKCDWCHLIFTYSWWVVQRVELGKGDLVIPHYMHCVKLLMGVVDGRSRVLLRLA
ncbi:hypothetical protein [Rubritalea tangerina]|uniref:hypothetical protein n=1 Tax=Rubritalea tangerina TaxID=430798 RepID=UPI003606CEBB